MQTFNTLRSEFEPYGLTCEQWQSDIMPRYDRHNEIELNFFPNGSITYFIQDRRVTIPPRTLVLFWGLIPHRIIQFEEVSSYYVCTIPLAVFLSWGLPETFIARILQGEVLMEERHERFAAYDCLLMENWFMDLSSPRPNQQTVLLEMQSRMQRMSAHASSNAGATITPIHSNETSFIEQMALFIACNYRRPIRLKDIGKAVGLHPDYANSLFKRAFGHTLNTHIIIERITQAQRSLLTTDTPIVQIAYDCGFNSVSSFNSAFLKINGCTPSHYRKAMHK